MLITWFPKLLLLLLTYLLLLFSFSVLQFLFVVSVRQTKPIHVGFRAHVKIASRIVSHRISFFAWLQLCFNLWRHLRLCIQLQFLLLTEVFFICTLYIYTYPFRIPQTVVLLFPSLWNVVPRFPISCFPPLLFGPAYSSLAFSTPVFFTVPRLSFLFLSVPALVVDRTRDFLVASPTS